MISTWAQKRPITLCNFTLSQAFERALRSPKLELTVELFIYLFTFNIVDKLELSERLAGTHVEFKLPLFLFDKKIGKGFFVRLICVII